MRRRPASRASLVAVLAVCSIAASCPRDDLSPEARRAYVVEQVADRVIAVQDAAIAANEIGELPDETAVVIVRFTVGALRVLQAQPDDWPAVVLASARALRADLEPAALSVIETALVTLEALVIRIEVTP